MRRSAAGGPRPEQDLKRTAKKLLSYLRVKAAPPAIFLLPDAQMRRLKLKFLKKRVRPGRADVLSFPEPRYFPHPESRLRVLGEIYLNRGLKDKSRRRYRTLLVHGLLHLLGYTHDKKSDTLKMKKAEARLLRRLKIHPWPQV